MLLFLVIYFIFYFYNKISSKKDGDFNSCSGILITECEICDSDSHRVL